MQPVYRREQTARDEEAVTDMNDRPVRPDDGIVLAITFQYYRDLPAAMTFYEEVMGLELAIDQGWSKIYRIADKAHIGLVDEARGMQDWAEKKTCQICLRVPDVDAWHAWIATRDVTGLTAPRDGEELGIRAFVFLDPEGYQIEIQSVLPGR